MPLFCVVLLEYIYSKGTIKMKKKVTKISLAVIIALLMTMLVVLAACGSEAPVTSEPPPQEEIQQDQTPLEQQPHEQESTTTAENDLAAAQDIGQGATVFNFQMFDGEGNVLSWNVHTDETTVGAALVEVGLIEGETSDFGLMVSHVNGIRADFVEDDAYWAFFVDDDFAMVGVDATDIEEGVTYKFIYTPA